MANYTQSFNENGYVVVPSIFKQSQSLLVHAMQCQATFGYNREP